MNTTNGQAAELDSVEAAAGDIAHVLALADVIAAARHVAGFFAQPESINVTDLKNAAAVLSVSLESLDGRFPVDSLQSDVAAMFDQITDGRPGRWKPAPISSTDANLIAECLRLKLGTVAPTLVDMAHAVGAWRDAQWAEKVGAGQTYMEGFSEGAALVRSQVGEVIQRAQRLVEYADFKLAGTLSASSPRDAIPSNAVSSVKARHLASLRDALATLAPLVTAEGLQTTDGG